MKKIYLLILLCLLGFTGFSTTYYSDCFTGGRVDSLKNWNTLLSGGGVAPTTFTNPGDVFIINIPMSDSVGWHVAGSVTITRPLTHPVSTSDTIVIGGSVTISGTGAVTYPCAGGGNIEIFIGGNLSVTGTTYFSTSSSCTPPNYIHLHFDGAPIYPASQLITWTSTGASDHTSISIENGSRTSLNSNVKIPTSSDTGFVVRSGGALICGTDTINGQGTNQFNMYSNGSIYTAHAGGLNGSIQNTGSQYFDTGAHYIFNGAIAQVTGTYMPTVLVVPGSDTINNSGAGVTLTQALTCKTGTSTNLEQGLFKISSTGLTMNGGTAVNVDAGTFDASPVYSPLVNLTYESLGLNAPAVTTGLELVPTLPTTTIGKILINKPGAIITLGSSATANDSIIINAGQLSAGFLPSYNLTAKSAWINNASATGFVPDAGTVFFAGSAAQHVGGSYPTDFNNLLLNNSAGAFIDTDEFVNDTLTLTSGDITLYTHNLTLEANAAPIQPGTFSTANMIIADSTGKVSKLCNVDSSFYFPIGDHGPNYSPIDIFYSHPGVYGAGAELNVNVTPRKHLANHDITDYTNRYWTVNTTFGGEDSVIATYVPGDVVGSESDIAMGLYAGVLPWTKYYPTNTVTHTLTSGAITIIAGGVQNFTGISKIGPSLTITADTLICGAAADTIKVLTVTRDTPFTYTWAPATGLSATTGDSVIATPTVTTTYTVTMTDANGFTSTATTTVSVSPAPSVAGVSVNSPICQDSTLVLASFTPSHVAAYSWTGPVAITGATLDTATVPDATTAAGGTYTLTVNNGLGIGCSATYTVSATVHPAAGPIIVTPPGPGYHTYCDSTMINASSIFGDAIYYHGLRRDTIATDSLLTAPITVYATGTYFFRPITSFGCWGNDDSVQIRINYAPTPLSVTGVTPNCDSTLVKVDTGGTGGTIYYQGTTSGGTSTLFATDSVMVYASGTYYFRAISDSGCWSVQGSDSVVINTHAGPVTASGGGTFCGQTIVRGSYSGSVAATVHYENTADGTDTTTADSLVVTASGTYYFRAISDTGGCWGTPDSATVIISPLPTPVTITPDSATFCDSVMIIATNADSGTIYYQGTSALGTSTATQDTFAMINTSGVYYFRALSAAGCWSQVTDSARITIFYHAAAVAASGAGTFCGSTVITGDVTDGSTVYFQGTTPGGTSTTMGGSPQTVTTSGTYYFRAQTAAGCWGAQDSVKVIIHTLPTAFDVTGGGGFCVGDTGKHVGLDGSQTGIKYELYKDSSFVTSLFGTGIALDYGLFTDSGTYTIVGIDTSTGCGNPMNSQAVVIANPLPVQYGLTPPIDSYCVGGAGIDLRLTASDNNVNYYVYNGASLVTIVPGTGFFDFDLGYVTAVGTYTVVATNPTTGCTANMLDSAVVKTNPLPTPYVVGGGGSYCAGGTGLHVVLGSSDTGISYQLNNDATAVGFPLTGTGGSLDFGIYTDGGTYTVVATNQTTGCVNTMTGSAVIIVDPLPMVGRVAGGGPYCSGGVGVPIELTVSETGVNYKLFVGDSLTEIVPGTGTPPPDFGPQTAPGTYTVVAINATTGCTDTMLDSAFISINGLPTAYSIFGGGAFCIGGIGYNVGITGSQLAKTYYLYRDAILIDSLPGTGSLLHFGYQTTGGTYTVVAKDDSTGCTMNMLGSTSIVVYSLPIVYNVGGGGHYCDGGTGRHITISGSNIGIAYRLLRGVDSIGGYVDGTGSLLDFGLYTVPGTYTMTAVNVVTGCTSNMDSSATITIDSLPHLFSLTGGGGYCISGAGRDIGLSGSDTGVYYQLYKGTVAVGSPLAGTDTALDFGLHTAAGVYTVYAVDSNTTCSDSMTSSATIVIHPLPDVHLITGGGSIIYCLGDTGIHVGLTTSDVGIAYQLYNGTTAVGDSIMGTGSALDFGLQTVGGTYTVIGTDTATGCSSTMSGSSVITVVPRVVPEFNIVAHPSLHIGVGSLDTLVAEITADSGTYATYQWYINNNPVPGATNAVFSFMVYFNTDSITCDVTSHGQCGGYTATKSVYITLFDVGVKQVTYTGADVKLMPNPNKGTFTLKGSLGTTDDQDVSIEVTDMLGQAVYHDKITAHNGVIDSRIQLNSTLANGMYLLNLRTATQNNIIHFVVEQ